MAAIFRLKVRDVFAINNSTQKEQTLSQIYTINTARTFSKDEAQALLPIIYRITKHHSEIVKGLIEQIDTRQKNLSNYSWKTEQEINFHIEAWKAKMQKLGILSRGLWIGDFPTKDEGYYCWKFPEKTIGFWHSKSDGYSKRISINDLTTPEKNLPL